MILVVLFDERSLARPGAPAREARRPTELVKVLEALVKKMRVGQRSRRCSREITDDDIDNLFND